MYIPQSTNRLDGAYFGSSLAHSFFQSYARTIVLAPKVHFFEPTLFGFKIAGKRGSKYFKPETGAITETSVRQKCLTAEMNAGTSRSDSAQQGSSAAATSKSHLTVPQQRKPRNRNSKSRHRGKKN